MPAKDCCKPRPVLLTGVHLGDKGFAWCPKTRLTGVSSSQCPESPPTSSIELVTSTCSARTPVESNPRVVAAAPLFVPRMPRTGKPFSVRMTNCGRLGWLADKDGRLSLRAAPPETGKAVATNPARAAGAVGRPWRRCAARCLPHQLLCARRENGPASGPRRGRLFRADRVGIAWRHRACSALAARRAKGPRRAMNWLPAMCS